MIRCDNFQHPGQHKQTPLCERPRKISWSERVDNWLERKLNPKQGRPEPTCPTCGNAKINFTRCTYCGRML